MRRILIITGLLLALSCSNDQKVELTLNPVFPPCSPLMVTAGLGTDSIRLDMSRSSIEKLLGEPMDSSGLSFKYISDDVSCKVQYSNSKATRIELECHRMQISGRGSLSWNQSVDRMKLIYGQGRYLDMVWYYDILGVGFRVTSDGERINAIVVFKPSGNNPVQLQTYIDSGFSLQYPDNWAVTVNDTGRDVSFMKPDRSAGISVKLLGTGTPYQGMTASETLDSICRSYMQNLSQDSSIAFLNKSSDDLGAYAAVKINYVKNSEYSVNNFYIYEFQRLYFFQFLTVLDSSTAFVPLLNAVKPTFIMIDTSLSPVPVDTTDTPQDTISSNGLIAFYKFDGNAHDAGPNGFHGTVIGAAVSADRLENSGSALHITGTQTIKLPGSSISQLGDFTFSCWLRFDQLNRSGSYPINSILSLANSSNSNEFIVGYEAVNSRFWGNIDATGEPRFDAVNTISAGTWFHWAIVRQGTTSRVYINGIQAGTEKSVTGSVLSVGEDGFLLGQDQDSYGGGFESYQALNGSIDDFCVFSRALTSDEISVLYSSLEPLGPAF